MRYNSKRYQKFRINLRDRLLDYVPAIDYGLSNEPFVFAEVKDYFARVECSGMWHVCAPQIPFPGSQS